MSMDLLSEDELAARIGGLEDAKTRLSSLKEEVEQEMMAEDGRWEGMAGQIQSCLSVRIGNFDQTFSSNFDRFRKFGK